MQRLFKLISLLMFLYKLALCLRVSLYKLINNFKEGVTMLLKHIKESIKQKHSNNGDKSLKNNYCINVTNEYRNIVANRKFKLAIRDSLKDYNITKDLQKTLLRKWIKQGGCKESFYALGSLKVLSLLKQK